MGQPDKERITVKLAREIDGRLGRLQKLSTERSKAAFLRVVVNRGICLFIKEMAESFKPNDCYENRGNQFEDPKWEASDLMRDIARKVDAQQNARDEDPRSLSLADLIDLAAEHGAERVNNWLQRQADANQAYRDRIEEELQTYLDLQGPLSTDDAFVDDYSHETFKAARSKEIAKLPPD